MKTDKQLKQDVEEELDWAPDVDSSHFAVEVKEGIVTLAGHRSSYAENLPQKRACSGCRASRPWLSKPRCAYPPRT